MRGRKPKPTALQVLHGNPGRRPLNAHEPQHASIDPACPSELTDPGARAEWERLIPTLARGHVTTVDRAALIGYCLKFAQWQACEVEAARHPFIVRGAKGMPMPNPAISLANRLYVVMMRAASELGLTPTSRARIVAVPPPGPDDDEFSKFQRMRER